jgi:hypothetical protein
VDGPKSKGAHWFALDKFKFVSRLWLGQAYPQRIVGAFARNLAATFEIGGGSPEREALCLNQPNASGATGI